MELIQTIRELWRHNTWADRRMSRALEPAAAATPEAVRELAHILGTQETWLARLERREPATAVWPKTPPGELDRLLDETHAAYARYLDALEERDLDAAIDYTNSAGDRFTNTVGEILLHVWLHGQYHRGKVNLLLRQAGAEPEWTDYIAFVRGAPAATEASSRR
jgi:uncharacterized damage-inducible protein DinB